jgi:hypothetical protein
VIKFWQNWYKQEVKHYGLRSISSLIWNKEELLDQWKESIIVPLHKKGNKTDCRNCGMLLLPISYKILPNTLSSVSSYIDEIIGDHQRGFWCNRSATDQISYIRQIRKKNGSTIRQFISYSWISRKRMIQLLEKYCTTFS